MQFLKNRGWIVHGVSRIELAIPVLPCIPYQLIVIDAELLGPSHNEFTRAVRKTRLWRSIPPVVLADSQGLASDTTLLELGAIAARISAWKADLSKLLLGFEQVENEQTV